MSDRIDDGGPARDMTLRDAFAAETLAGLWSRAFGEANWTLYADVAYKQADAMIERRKHATPGNAAPGDRCLDP